MRAHFDIYPNSGVLHINSVLIKILKKWSFCLYFNNWKTGAHWSVPLLRVQMQTISNSRDPTRQSTPDPGSDFTVGQRVHFTGQPRRIGTVKYVGPVEGYSGIWVGVDWDADGEGKHDGSHNGVSYFTARGPDTASFVRPHNLSSGVSLLEALATRYQTASTKEEEGKILKEVVLPEFHLLHFFEMLGLVHGLVVLELNENLALLTFRCISKNDECISK